MSNEKTFYKVVRRIGVEDLEVVSASGTVEDGKITFHGNVDEDFYSPGLVVHSDTDHDHEYDSESETVFAIDESLKQKYGISDSKLGAAKLYLDLTKSNLELFTSMKERSTRAVANATGLVESLSRKASTMVKVNKKRMTNPVEELLRREWDRATIDAYLKLEENKHVRYPEKWNTCPLCGQKPRVWIFDNGRYAKCLCSREKYDLPQA